MLIAGGFEVRQGERRLLLHGEPVALGGRAFDLLLVLIERRDRVVGKDELLSLVWPGSVVEENNLTVQVSSLRKALGSSAISTVAGRGYRFTLPLLERAPEAAPATSAKHGVPVLAVLPFDNLSSDAEMLFFSDGVSEEIIRRLARAATFKVIGRTSSFQFRGTRKSDAAIQLSCSHILDGSIRRAAGRLRISAHLMDAASQTTLWSDHYDRGIDDIFAIQDEIAESIARTLDHALREIATLTADPATYDLYLQASPKSYAPDDLRACVRMLEVVTQRAPHFAEAWGRLAYLRGFMHMYLPFAERGINAARVVREASHALALDSGNIDALASRCLVTRPFGDFIDWEPFLQRLRDSSSSGDGRRYIGWLLRQTGRVRESLEETEEGYRLDSLDPMMANMVALARMAAGRLSEAVPVYESLVSSNPDMNFPIASLLRAQAYRQDWAAVDRLLAVAARRPLREFGDTIPFVTAKREPTPERLGAWRERLATQVASSGHVDIARLVYTAHLGLVDDAYHAADGAGLGPSGSAEDIMGPDGYRTALMFDSNMPELRNDPRFPSLCARVGLVEFWVTTGKWPDCVSTVPYDFKVACEQLRNTTSE